MRIDTKRFIPDNLKIKTTKPEIKSLISNYPQRKLDEALEDQRRKGQLQRAIVLKARRVGISTWTGGLMFVDTITNFNFTTAIVAHEDKATSNLFDMYKLFYNELPAELQPQLKASNAYELNFNNDRGTGLNSKIICFTAGGKGVGRSFGMNDLHVSEYAWWPGDKKTTLNGLLACVPKTKNSRVVIESTAHGFDDFKDLCDDARGGDPDCALAFVFIAWWEMIEYTMKPLDDFVLTENERRIKAVYDLTDGQMFWRRYTIHNECGGDLNLFHQEYPANPDEAFIATGDPVFDNQKIIEQRVIASKAKLIGEDGNPTERKPRKGIFEYKKTVISMDEFRIDDSSIKFIESENGPVTIYEEPRVERDKNGIAVKTCPYAIGGDLAKTGKDYNTAKCINAMTRMTSASLRKQRMDEDIYADQLYCMGKYYHYALIGIETNTSTRPHRVLEMLRYEHIYIREQMDVLEHRIVPRLGFETNTLTRPVIVSGLVELMRDYTYIEVDDATLGEMLTFVKDDKGKACALEGKHDDMVMATAIAHFICGQQKATWAEAPKSETSFIKKNFKTNTEPKGGIIQW